jgi:hypothetical protein
MANAPFSTNGAVDADRVDGLDSSALTTRTYRYTVAVQTAVSSFSTRFPSLPAGTYLVTYDLFAPGVVGASATEVLTCASAGKFTLDDDFGRTVTCTRIDDLRNGAASLAARASAPGGLLPEPH